MIANNVVHSLLDALTACPLFIWVIRIVSGSEWRSLIPSCRTPLTPVRNSKFTCVSANLPPEIYCIPSALHPAQLGLFHAFVISRIQPFFPLHCLANFSAVLFG